jgi:hypothetical protein
VTDFLHLDAECILEPLRADMAMAVAISLLDIFWLLPTENSWVRSQCLQVVVHCSGIEFCEYGIEQVEVLLRTRRLVPWAGLPELVVP